MSKPGSGLYFTLKPGETLRLKGTDYVIKNDSEIVTATLRLYTQEYETFLKDQQRKKELKEMGIGPHLSSKNDPTFVKEFAPKKKKRIIIP